MESEIGGLTSAEIDRFLAAAKAGEAEGFAGLYRVLSPAVLAVTVAEGAKDPQQATNTILVNTFDDLSSFVGDHADLALFTYQNARSYLSDDALLDPPSEVGSDDDSVNQQDGLGDERLTFLVNEATSLLDPTQREVIALRIYFGLSRSETARVLQLSAESVSEIQDRVRARFDELAAG